MLRKFAVGSVLALCAACAGPAAQKPAAGAKTPTPALASAGQRPEVVKPILVCEMERPTGSNIPERVCRPATQDEISRMVTQDAVRQMQKPGPSRP